MPLSEPCRLETELPVILLIRPTESSDPEWTDFDLGPGIFTIPTGHEVSVRIKNIDNKILAALVKEIQGCPAVTELNLTENRNITDDGIKKITPLKQLTSLNLSSCDITDAGLEFLPQLTHLRRLNLSFCNRISDLGVKKIQTFIQKLDYLDLQGCVRLTNAGINKIEHRNLTIHHKRMR